MYVIKRNGKQERVEFSKVTARLKKLSYGLDPLVDHVQVAQKVVSGIYPGVKTSELDLLAAETAAYMAVQHVDYSIFAARIAVSNLHKTTPDKFSACAEMLFRYTHEKTGLPASLLSDDVWDVVRDNADLIDGKIVKDRDFQFDFFGFKTLERSYLLKVNGDIVERPQHMFMRVALGIHGADLDSAFETYDLLSRKKFIHATPTLFNAGTRMPQMSSCYLVAMKEDSIDGIYSTLGNCAKISKYAGGIGLSVHDVRAAGTYISGTNGYSNGLVPMLRVFNDSARYVDQGGGKRKGSIAVYLEPWHADVFQFLELKRNHGDELQRARDLFYAMWISDLFMERVEADEDWSLFCPHVAPGLAHVYGAEFNELYARYEAEGKATRTVKARAVWQAICDSQIETGTPYILYKDAANRKSNQKNLGTIMSSNLCCEILQYSSPDETAVCNLASINLTELVTDGAFDFMELRRLAGVLTRNLNKVIAKNFYPVEEARRSNMRHRPVGIGVQGLADAFCKMRFPFASEEAAELNRGIFETIYFGALEASCELAEACGPYASYEGSPASEGKLQFDLWDARPSDRWDWGALKERIATHGLRNSLLVAPMPTASTAQILGNNEGTEAFTSNLYVRRVLAGEFIVANRYLMKDLMALGLWDADMINALMATGGSVQDIARVPDDIKELYKTVWEISQKTVISQAADRGPFVDQSQSMNLHVANPTVSLISSMQFFGWRKGLKTGCYYLRSRPKAEASKFTVDKSKLACSLINREDCEMCSA
ncbi:unnamed protein product [Chrysoparadoxa australica]